MTSNIVKKMLRLTIGLPVSYFPHKDIKSNNNKEGKEKTSMHQHHAFIKERIF